MSEDAVFDIIKAVCIVAILVAIVLNFMTLYQIMNNREIALEECIQTGENRIIDGDCVIVNPVVKEK